MLLFASFANLSLSYEGRFTAIMLDLEFKPSYSNCFIFVGDTSYFDTSLY